LDSPDPEAMGQVLAIVAGAGLSGTVSGLVKGVVPQITPDIAGAGAGLLLWYFGDRVHPLVKAFGVGVLAGSLKGMIEKAIPPVLGAPAAPAGAPSGTGQGGQAAAAMAEAYAIQESR